MYKYPLRVVNLCCQRASEWGWLLGRLGVSPIDADLGRVRSVTHGFS